MTMKNVAGFHSFDFGFLGTPQFTVCPERRRNGFGIILFQNDGCMIVGIELTRRGS